MLLLPAFFSALRLPAALKPIGVVLPVIARPTPLHNFYLHHSIANHSDCASSPCSRFSAPYFIFDKSYLKSSVCATRCTFAYRSYLILKYRYRNRARVNNTHSRSLGYRSILFQYLHTASIYIISLCARLTPSPTPSPTPFPLTIRRY